jgi:YbbR domain-containing protein
LLQRNLGLKLIALLLAYLAWTVVVGRPELSTVSRIPVVVRPGPNTVVVAHEPKTLTVEFSGLDRAALRQEQLSAVRAELEIGDLSTGDHQLPVAPDDLRPLPAGVRANPIESVVSVTIEARAVREVAVSIGLAGNPPERYTVTAVTAVPDIVTASGAKSRVDTLDSVSTESVDLEGRTESFTRSVKLLLPAGGNVSYEPSTVDVTVEIDEVPVTEILQLEIGGVPQGWRISPSNVEVSISAPPALVEQALAAAVASLSLDKVPEGSAEAQVLVSFPELPEPDRSRVRVDSIAPRAVTIERAGRGI